MKSPNLLKIAGVILIGITLAWNVQAANDKNSRQTKSAISQLTHTVRLTVDDIRIMQLLLAQSDVVHVSWNNSELTFALREGDVAGYTVRFEALNGDPIEDWMFETDYLNEENQAPVEGWMMEEDYLNMESASIESWMLSETHLSVAETGTEVESWMLDAHYLSR